MVVAIMGKSHKGVSKTNSMEAETVHEEAPASSDELNAFDWRAHAVVVRQRGQEKKFIRQAAMQAFLTQITDGKTFAFRGLQTDENFSYPEFCVIIQWLRIRNLAMKSPGGYVIPSVNAIRQTWNKEITEAVKI